MSSAAFYEQQKNRRELSFGHYVALKPSSLRVQPHFQVSRVTFGRSER